eukprot:14253289-Heterocapsa_arctica.AAC.1
MHELVDTHARLTSERCAQLSPDHGHRSLIHSLELDMGSEPYGSAKLPTLDRQTSHRMSAS